jgi:hypothetical protein
MDNPDVLTDYYTRRHTKQYRAHFFSLAEEFMMKVFEGNKGVPLTPSEVAECKKKTIALLHKSLEVMPADFINFILFQ